MYCPNVECPDVKRSGIPGEYRPGISVCPKCGHPLVDSQPELATVESSNEELAVEYQEFVEVCSLHDPGAVPLVKSLLMSAGIRFFIKNERVQQLIGGGTLGIGYNLIAGPPLVLVEPGRAEEARQLLLDVNNDA